MDGGQFSRALFENATLSNPHISVSFARAAAINFTRERPGARPINRCPACRPPVVSYTAVRLRGGGEAASVYKTMCTHMASRACLRGDPGAERREFETKEASTRCAVPPAWCSRHTLLDMACSQHAARAAARPPTAAPTTIDGATRGHRPRRALRRRTSCAQQVGGLLERRRHHELGYGHTAALQNVLRVEPVGEERHAAVAPARRAVPTQPSRTYAAQERRTTSQLSELPRPGGSTRRGTSAWQCSCVAANQRGQQARQTRVS